MFFFSIDLSLMFSGRWKHDITQNESEIIHLIIMSNSRSSSLYSWWRQTHQIKSAIAQHFSLYYRFLITKHDTRKQIMTTKNCDHKTKLQSSPNCVMMSKLNAHSHYYHKLDINELKHTIQFFSFTMLANYLSQIRWINLLCYHHQSCLYFMILSYPINVQ